MPPEALHDLSKAPEKNAGPRQDIYAAGVILFNLLTGCMPYSKATEDNELFMKFVKNREAFWEYHNKYSFCQQIAPELKELLNGILDPNPDTRWTIQQIKSCAWYNGDTATPKYVQKEMKKRKSSVNLAKSNPEMRVEITKSWTAKSKDRCRKTKKKSLDVDEINYEHIGTFMWKVCISLFGK